MSLRPRMAVCRVKVPWRPARAQRSGSIFPPLAAATRYARSASLVVCAHVLINRLTGADTLCRVRSTRPVSQRSRLSPERDGCARRVFRILRFIVLNNRLAPPPKLQPRSPRYISTFEPVRRLRRTFGRVVEAGAERTCSSVACCLSSGTPRATTPRNGKSLPGNG